MTEKVKLDKGMWFEPMLCESGSESDLDNPNYIATLKADGTRVIVEKTLENGFRIFSRRGLTYNKTLPEMTEKFISIPQLFRLDGEIVYIDNEGHQVFAGSQFRCQISNAEKVKKYKDIYPVGIFLFDILNLNNIDLIKHPFIKRWAILSSFHSLNSMMYNWNNIRLIPITLKKREMFEWTKNNGLEGVVLKKIDGKYEEGERSINYLKVKCREHSIFTLMKQPKDS